MDRRIRGSHYTLLATVEARAYARELEASGARPLQRWVVAFDGKEVKLKKLLPEGSAHIS